MRFFNRLLKKRVYHALHPLLRFYRRLWKPGASGARAILLCKGETLLVRNIGVGYWSLPGGVMRPSESPIRCLTRELKEELGISLLRQHYRHKLGTYFHEGEKNIDTIHIFVLEVSSFNHTRDWELDEARWFKLDALPEHLSPATARRIDEFRGGKKRLYAEW